MDHNSSSSQINLHSVRRIVHLLATPVTLIALLVALIYAGFWGWDKLTAPLPTKPPTPCVTKASKIIRTSDVSVKVLNGGFTTGLANKVSNALKEKGFNVIKTGNIKNERIKQTVIIAKSKTSPEAILTAKFFTKASIRSDERIDGTVDVLVGTDFGEMNLAAPVTLPVSSGVICTPPSPTPSPAHTPAIKK